VSLLRSIRSRVWMGAVLWTLGMFAVITILLTLSVSAMGSVRVIHAHSHAAAAIAIPCMLIGLLLVRAAISPFHKMRRRLAEVRQGHSRQLDGWYPSEVQPLVDDLNALLTHNERAVTRATAKAGDLAHGLKTPLAVLSNEAARLGREGHTELAATIAQQVALMQRQVDYHLAHARAAASGATPGARCVVGDSAAGIARTLRRLHAERGLTIDVEVPPDLCVRAQPEDVDEMLGNLLDNACKWARTRVEVTAASEGAAIAIAVDDDGTGLDASKREVVLQRGVRADEAAPGSGFGLAIVRELAELYEGTIALDASPLGGLRATLHLPGCDRG
jgi:signal transduction histidine kinase